MGKSMIKKLITLTAILTIIISLITHINLNTYATENKVVDSTYIIDENDNINVISRTEKDLIEAKKELENRTYTVKVTLGNVSEVVGQYKSLKQAMNCYNETIAFFNEVSMFTGDQSSPDVEVNDGDDIIASTEQIYGVVRFNRSKSTISYTEVKTGNSGYISAAYAGDAAYLKTEGDYIYAKVSGVDIKVNVADVEKIEPYADNLISSYSVKNGYLYHDYAFYSGSTLTTEGTKVGYKPDYMEVNKKYYSYDGHYFYETFEKMIDDYVKGTYENAINKDKPHYNYYQYLSLHTKSVITPAQYDGYIASYNKTNSVLNNAGQMIINTQNHYTVNSLLMLGVTINESAWGTSKYAVQRYNLFGIGAVDSNPDAAKTFDSVEHCLNYWAYDMVSKGYLNGTDSRYRGPHLGDKNSGLGVKYSSDPYWGEKAAARGYVPKVEAYKDYGRYSIAIAQKTVQLYKEPSVSSTGIYTTSTSNDKAIYDYPLTVLEKVSANGVDFYKVRSDMPLREDRSRRDVEAVYNASRDYVYVKASDVTLVSQGTGKDIADEYNYVEPKPDVPVVPEQPPVIPEKTHEEVLAATKLTHSNGYLTGFKLGANISDTIKSITDLDERIVVTVKDKDGNTKTSATVATGMTITVKTNNTTKTYTCVIRGDADGDGNLYATDYIRIKNHIMGKSTLAKEYLFAADVDADSNVYATDYVKLKNYIMGKGTINQ